jgi:hypothetical protein
VATAASHPVSDATSYYVLVTNSSNITVTVDTESYRESGSSASATYYNASISAYPSSGITNGSTVTATSAPTDTYGNPITSYSSISYTVVREQYRRQQRDASARRG